MRFIVAVLLIGEDYNRQLKKLKILAFKIAIVILKET